MGVKGLNFTVQYKETNLKPKCHTDKSSWQIMKNSGNKKWTHSSIALKKLLPVSPSQKISMVYLSFQKGFAKFQKCVGCKTQYLVSYLNFASFASYIRQNNEFKINMTSPHLWLTFNSTQKFRSASSIQCEHP